MKTLLAGLLAAAAVAPASAAYVQIDWTSGGYTFSGQLQLGSVTSGTVTETTPGLGSLTITATDGGDVFSPASIVLPQSGFVGGLASTFSFNLSGPTATKTAGYAWYLGDSGANGLYGTVGTADWGLDGNGASAVNLLNQADTLVLTVVPEPELMAGVAALGLVSFALIRRKVA